MGHSKVQTTLSIYSHVISKSVFETTAKTLDKAFAGIIVKNENVIALVDGTSALLPQKI